MFKTDGWIRLENIQGGAKNISGLSLKYSSLVVGYISELNSKYLSQQYSRLMVGYGAHTRVPHMSSPLFSWLAYWMEVNRSLSSSWLIILIRIYCG